VGKAVFFYLLSPYIINPSLRFFNILDTSSDSENSPTSSNCCLFDLLIPNLFRHLDTARSVTEKKEVFEKWSLGHGLVVPKTLPN
jgi:hypothetical protein